MGRLLKVRLKVILHDRVGLFWTLMFPIILSLFFNMALRNIGKADQFAPVTIGLVQTQQNPEIAEALQSLADVDDPLIILQSFSVSEASLALAKGQVDVVVDLGPQTPTLAVRTNGYEATLTRSILEQILRIRTQIALVAKTDPAALNDVLQSLQEDVSYLQEQGKSTDPAVIYFYTLVGMSAMYGSGFGIDAASVSQANLSALGMRNAIAPIKRWKLVVSAVLAGWLVHVTELVIQYLWLRYGLGIDFGVQTGWVALLCLFGSLAGISFGFALSVGSRLSLNVKSSVSIIVSMVMSFLSGMMIWNIKYWIDQKLPILSKINPVALVTDALYGLSYSGGVNRLLENVFWLLGFSLVMIGFSILKLQRRDYATL